ncbi:MAG: SIMPL domain-containing protein [Alcaligenaceae bacterium]|nr:SIMPL domain-containing protein [Alcaligenaceae bacterium]
MKIRHLAFLLPALFATQLSFAQQSSGSIAASRAEDRPVINLSADSYREVQQDRVILTLSREARGTESQAIADEVNKAINAVMESGKANDTLKLKTGSYNFWPQQDYDEKGKKTGKTTYVARGEVIVTSTDMVEATRFVEEVSEQMNLSNINFDLTTEVRRQIENEIRGESIQSFQEKARAISREFGFDNYDIKYVQLRDSTSNMSPVPRMAMARADSLAEAKFSGPELEAGKERVTISLTGEIALY